MAQQRITQAVVIIHGIGEQRPMETLRRFADAVLPEPEQGGEKYFSKPDPLSESFELRKLQDRSQPRTHLYEYYWAYKVEGTKFGHVRSWLTSLLWRRPGRVPKHLQPLWWLSWILIAIAAIAAFAGIAQAVSDFTARFPPFLVSLTSLLLLSILQGGVLYYLGDAARYLSPQAKNIRLRHDIRADGIKLLQKIHESKKYERVIVVGHSLGSVIAYDILMHLWQKYNTEYAKPKESTQEALSTLEAAGETLSETEPNTDAYEDALDNYQIAQNELWLEMRSLGNPWLVTDLITLGSPLAHASLLLAGDADDLQARQRQRELPTSPPIADESEKRGGKMCRRYSYRVWEPYDGNITLRALHHAGLYACTRWTNIFYPARWGIFGDLVGGPLRPWFGPGTKDIAVRSDSWLRRNTLLAHLSYWRSESPTPNNSDGKPLALDTLIDALDLEGMRTFSQPEPKS